ncbi:MAG: hypothetical protein WCD70_03615 [Alphaproteobacteria bacterium]
MTSDIRQLWMIVRTDLHGTAYLVEDGLGSEAAAKEKIKTMLAKHSKLHGQDYSIHDYVPTTRAQRLQELRVLI